MQEEVYKENLGEYVQDVLSVLEKANIVFPAKATVNVYHHCGVEYFTKMGAVFINIVNRSYCKSYVIMIPGQKYPKHYHKIKTESFYVLYGTLNVRLNDKMYQLKAGEMLHIERGQDHEFWTDTEVVFEEISTPYMPNDSFYADPNIGCASYAQRRTTISSEEWKEIYNEWKK